MWPDVALGEGEPRSGGTPEGCPGIAAFFRFTCSEGVLACFSLFFLVFKTLFLGALEP